jgi:two-component system sensor kinase
MSQPDRDDLPHTQDYAPIRAGYEPNPPGISTVSHSPPAVPGYDVLEVLGAGGMGIVYLAYDRKRRQTVALKTLRRVDPAALYGLKLEFRTLTEVAHRNLVHYYELVAGDDQWYLTMELVRGVSFLAHVRGANGICLETAGAGSFETAANASSPIADGEPFLPAESLERLRTALRQLAEGVAAIHQMGKLHRDLKPSNVMVTPEARVVILDFGLAAELDRRGELQSDEDQIVGTFAYMAPEQAAGGTVTPASDWYSVGVMLYEALTGRLPFAHAGLEVLTQKQWFDPAPPRSLAPGAPADLNDLCTALLSRNPASRPSGAEVLRRLGGALEETRFATSATGSPQYFIGREPHLKALQDAFLATRESRPVAILVQGRSGAGKSMLVQSFLDRLKQEQNVVVMAGKCYERESVPYKALDSLLDALSRHLRSLPAREVESLLPDEVHLLTRVFPVLGRVEAIAAAGRGRSDVIDPHESRRRAFAALRNLLARLGKQHALVLFIDDLQWGDAESAAALAELLQPPDPPVFLLLGSYRSEELETSACLGPLLRAWEQVMPEGDLRRLPVEPLTPEEALQLARELLGRAGSAESQLDAEAIARESGGNPFFVQVLAQSYGGNANCGQESSEGDLTLDQVLWRRIQELPVETRRLLEVIAVSGQPLPQGDACQAAGLAGRQQGTLAQLRFHRLVRGAGPTEREEVETYHDRVRETILARLPGDARKEHHRRLAEALEASAAEIAPVSDEALAARLAMHAPRRLFDLAYHYDAAGDGSRALPFALAAAEQARARHALEIAEQQYRIAQRGAAAADGSTRLEVAEGLGQVLMLRGVYEEAARQFEVARDLATDRLAQARIEGSLGEVAFKRGDLPATGAAIERALRHLGKRVPRWSWMFGVLALWEVAVQALHTCFPQWFLARRPLAGAEPELTAVRLYSRLGYAYWFCRGPIPCFWTHLRDMNLAERYPPTRELAQAYSEHAPAMSMIGWFSRGIAYAEKSLAIRRSLGDAWGEGQTLHFYGVVLYAASRFDECIDKCRKAGALLEQTGDPWELNSARYQVALSLYRLGDLPGAVQEAWRFHQAALELGDVQGAAMSLDVWAMASRGKVPGEVIRAELDRPSDDVQRAAQVLLAEAVRLLAEGRTAEAATELQRGVAGVRKAGISNGFVAPVFAWLATALRRQAEECNGGERKVLLRRADRAARQAERIARRFQNDLPHALRERALIAALQGHSSRARRLFDQSLSEAERQGARYEQAQSLAARGRVGTHFAWPDADSDVQAGRAALEALGLSE